MRNLGIDLSEMEQREGDKPYEGDLSLKASRIAEREASVIIIILVY